MYSVSEDTSKGFLPLSEERDGKSKYIRFRKLILS